MKENHVAVILEDMNQKFDIVFEMASNIGQMMQDITDIKRRVVVIEEECTTFKAAIRDTNRDVQDHEFRITTLEAT